MDHLTFDGAVGDFEKKNILQVYLHQKKTIHVHDHWCKKSMHVQWAKKACYME